MTDEQLQKEGKIKLLAKIKKPVAVHPADPKRLMEIDNVTIDILNRHIKKHSK